MGKFEFAQGVRYERADYKVKRTSSTGPGIDTTTDEDNFAYEVQLIIYIQIQEKHISDMREDLHHLPPSIIDK